jgi:hypothetical protein
MAKYDPLRDYLRKLPSTTTQVTLTFAQIERILDNDLPPASRTWFRFWENGPGTVQSDAWHNAGWETIMVDMENETVKFQRG